MEAAIAGMQACRESPEQYTEYDVAFHTAVATATHNDLINVLLRPISDLLMEMVRVSLGASRAVEEGLAHHRNILARIKERDAEGARQAMREHLKHAQGLVETVRNTVGANSQ
jgi:DNA-binding FadR family transcriptional regulator